MNLIAAAAVLLVVLPALASAPQEKATAPAAKDRAAVHDDRATTRTFRGKAQAPVTITTRVASESATVTVRFLSAASDVSIEARGLAGLTVTGSGSVLSGGRFVRGESIAFDVAFSAGPGRSQLVVSVSGRFGPATRSTVAVFPVGEADAAQQKASSGDSVTDSTGQRIKVMPGETR
jgi:hypothetical protein